MQYSVTCYELVFSSSFLIYLEKNFSLLFVLYLYILLSSTVVFWSHRAIGKSHKIPDQGEWGHQYQAQPRASQRLNPALTIISKFKG